MFRATSRLFSAAAAHILELPASTSTSPAALGQAFKMNGFAMGAPIIPESLLARAVQGMDEVMNKKYNTGRAPLDSWYDGDDTKLRKIDNAHVSNTALLDLVTYPPLGQFVAQAVGAKMLQAWVVQLLYKPPSSSSTAVGWHQDSNYWRLWWTPESEVFTIWIALSNITASAGPMCLIERSHVHGDYSGAVDFFGKGDDEQLQSILAGLRANPASPSSDSSPSSSSSSSSSPSSSSPQIQTSSHESSADWIKRSIITPPGGFSIHHRHTLHGSTPNTSSAPRRAIAVHVRTEKSTPTPGRGVNPTDPHAFDYVAHVSDHTICPIMYKE